MTHECCKFNHDGFWKSKSLEEILDVLEHALDDGPCNVDDAFVEGVSSKLRNVVIDEATQGTVCENPADRMDVIERTHVLARIVHLEKELARLHEEANRPVFKRNRKLQECAGILGNVDELSAAINATQVDPLAHDIDELTPEQAISLQKIMESDEFKMSTIDIKRMNRARTTAQLLMNKGYIDVKR